MPAQRHCPALPHSSDTERFSTPVRKRFRAHDDDAATPAASSSASPLASPRKRQRRDSPKKPPPDLDLERLLRAVIAAPASHDAVLALKAVPRDENSARALARRLMHAAKAAVVQRTARRRAPRLLETELYTAWLAELAYVPAAFEIALNAKQPGTRRRVPGLGRAAYAALYHLLDAFIDEVNTHHDRPPAPAPAALYPPTLTLVEEARDPATDARSDAAAAQAARALLALDGVLADAVRRYKAECGRNNPALAGRISAMEHALAKACCLLCEQTGYGASEDDMGDVLMEETRDVMVQWKNEYEDCEDQLDTTDEEI